MLHVLITDDHPIFRKGLRQVLSESDKIEQIDEAGSGREAVQKIREHHYDVVTMDVSMPEADGLEILKQIKYEHPDVPVLMLSIYPEEQFALRALRAGAAGYLTKTSVPDELVTAVERIATGGTYITTSIAEKLMSDFKSPQGVTRYPHEKLSDREYEVLLLIGEGLTVSDIAAKLNLSVKTISTHRAHILKKTDMNSNAQLMRYVLDHKLLEK